MATPTADAKKPQRATPLRPDQSFRRCHYAGVLPDGSRHFFDKPKLVGAKDPTPLVATILPGTRACSRVRDKGPILPEGKRRVHWRSEHIVMRKLRTLAWTLLDRNLRAPVRINPQEQGIRILSMKFARFSNTIASALRHPGVIALIVAGTTIAVMLIVDHGPWSRAKTQPSHVAAYATTGEAARAAGAKVLQTEKRSPIEPERAGPKPSPAVNPVTP